LIADVLITGLQPCDEIFLSGLLAVNKAGAGISLAVKPRQPQAKQ